MKTLLSTVKNVSQYLFGAECQLSERTVKVIYKFSVFLRFILYFDLGFTGSTSEIGG